VRPAAFHANAIVMVGCGFVGVDGIWVAGEGVRRLLSSARFRRGCGSEVKITWTSPTTGQVDPTITSALKNM
jgi:hypothetical protein